MSRKNKQQIQETTKSEAVQDAIELAVDQLSQLVDDHQAKQEPTNGIAVDSVTVGPAVLTEAGKNLEEQPQSEALGKRRPTEAQLALKGPYDTEESARATPYINEGPRKWDLQEVTYPVEGGTKTVYVWEVNLDHAISLVARKNGYSAGKAGARVGGNGLKSKLEAAEKRMEEMAAKLKAAGIEF